MQKRTAKTLLLSLAAPIPILLCSAFLQAQQLTIQTEDGKQTVLQRADIEALPHTKAPGRGAVPVTYEGVLLRAVLEKAGVDLDQGLRGKRMALCLLVEAADGYRAVIALPEISPAFDNKQIVLAFMRDGKPLDDKEGPYRVIVPEDKMMARWVRQVTTLKIVPVQ